MADVAARDVAVESVFLERENITKRARSLDIIEDVVASLTDEQIAAILSLPDVLIRAAQSLSRKQQNAAPCGGPGRPPCGQHR